MEIRFEWLQIYESVGLIGCLGEAEKPLLVKVKNASGRIGIFIHTN